VIGAAQRSSLFVAPASWIFVVGAWIWRGRVRARWREVGFESDVFELFIKMKGGATRIKLLNALEVPKDRLQVAQEVGIDWKAVDRHMQILNKYGFVHEKATYGTAKVYEVTPLGNLLLRLYEELEEADMVRLVEQKL
jgi:predicted transcriptional regulator